MGGWIGVDLDGTLATYPCGFPQIGPPILLMVNRVRQWLDEGKDVRIFTARVHVDPLNPDWVASARELLKAHGYIEAAFGVESAVAEAWEAIERNRIYEWCREQFGCQLPVTCEKDFQMIELWDDRCVQVIPNHGVPLQELYEAVERRTHGQKP